MNKILIKNPRILDPASNRDETANVLVENGKITKIGGPECKGCTEIIDGEGKILIPGVIDLHVHLRDFDQVEKETVKTGTMAAKKGGVTTVFCMPNTQPKLDSEAAIRDYQALIDTDAHVHVHIVGAISESLKGQTLAELEKYPALGIRIITDDGFDIDDEGLLEQAYKKAAELGLIVMTHPEMMSIAPKGVVNEGKISQALGIPGQPNEKEWKAVERGIRMAAKTGARAHFTHISTRESVALVRQAKEQGVRVTCDCTPHHFCLTEEAVPRAGSMAKVNPPLRTEEDRMALIEGLKDGTIDAIVTDHAPHRETDKTEDITTSAFGFSEIEISLPLSITELHFRQGMPLIEVIRLMTEKPAAIAGLLSGRIEEGAAADLTLIDLETEKTVDRMTFISKGKNTPFHGTPLKGWAVKMIVGR